MGQEHLDKAGDPRLNSLPSAFHVGDFLPAVGARSPVADRGSHISLRQVEAQTRSAKV